MAEDKLIKEIKLKVAEAIQDDVNKGIVRIDSSFMQEINVKSGDIVELEGERKTVAIVDRAYPGDIGLNIIRMDGIARRNAKTGIGEMVSVSKALVKEAKSVVIAPARKGIMIRATSGIFKQGLLGRAVIKGDILSIGGTSRRRTTMSHSPFFEDIFNIFDESMAGFGFGDIKFIVADTNPKQAVVITEATIVELNPEAVEIAEEKVPEVSYEDIGGLSNEIQKIREMVELPLKHPEIFERLGIEAPKGVLLHGPPGTGKTLLAKAVANETNSHFILINGPEIMSKFYGQSEENLRKKFGDAEKNAPSIIFIDEIDAIATKREETHGEVERRVVAQLLALMDGLKSRGKVVVIAASNIPQELDPALRRPGRFDREIEIGVPGAEGRLNILKIHTRNMPLDYWDVEIAAKVLLEKIDLTEKLFNKKIEENQSKIESLNSMKIEKERELTEAHNELNSLEIERKKLRTDSTLLRKIIDKISNTHSIVKHLESKIKGIEEEINNINQSVKEIKKNIPTIKKRREEINKDKRLLNSLIVDITNIKHTSNIWGQEDVRNVFSERKLKSKDKEVEEIESDFLETGIISIEYFSDVRKKSIVIMLEELANITHGFVGADLAALCKESAMIVLRRILPDLKLKEEEAIPKDILEKLRVTKDDFKEALKVVRPSAMREVLVEVPNVRWNDIGGLEKVKQELIEAVEWPLKHPESFKRLGVKPPRGILLYGAPGTGKTLLAKAVATESESNFIPIKGPELISKWVGESEKAVRKIFQKARQTSPSIIFFDEIDSLASRRGSSTDTHGTSDKVVNQLLTEMNGLEDLTDVVVLAATNRPDMLDPSLLRPGRFDRIILTPIPDEKTRLEIFKRHTKGMPLKLNKDKTSKSKVERKKSNVASRMASDEAIQDRDLEKDKKKEIIVDNERDASLLEFAKKTEGYVGADIEAVCREAAILALREDIKSEFVTMKHFEQALKEVGPSVTKDIERLYEEMQTQFKAARAKEMEQVKPAYMG